MILEKTNTVIFCIGVKIIINIIIIICTIIIIFHIQHLP